MQEVLLDQVRKLDVNRHIVSMVAKAVVECVLVHATLRIYHLSWFSFN